MSKELALSQEGRILQANMREHLAGELQRVLPPTLRPERLIMTIVQAGERNPALYSTNPQSLMMAALTMGTLALECDGVTGQGYIIPFGRSAQPVIGYKGYNTLGARNGWTITGTVVREGDRFEYELGTEPVIRHVPKDRNSGAPITHAWAVAMHAGMSPIIEVLDIDQVVAVQKRSPGAKKRDSPWNDREVGFPAMAAKTAKRRLARHMPTGWVNTGAVMEDQWERGKAAYVQIEDGAPAVRLATEYASEPLTPAPDEPVLDVEVEQEWLLHIPGRDPLVYGSAKGWYEAMSKKLRTNAKSPRLAEFWAANAQMLEALGRESSEAAERLQAQYRHITSEGA